MKAAKIIGAAVVAVVLANQTGSATQYDLVNNNSQTVPGTGGNDAIFEKASTQPTGTGVFDPFLRVQQNDFEKGFNTSTTDNPPNWDAKNGVWTHDLLFSDLQYMDIGGSDYYQFMLDLGEPSGGNKELILLQTFNLYTSDTASQTQSGISDNPDNLGTKHFGLEGNTIMFVDESSGNGESDVAIYVPKSAFVNTHTYLYLYTEFGLANGGDGASDGTFEEFAARTGPNRVPDSGTSLFLLGSALSGLGCIGRFMKR